ncbi:MAG: diaminopimelate decarboxylase [Clostridia bacterium]|nr:diaminopimelate decarboxylase [Clostridia bacterium]
MQKKPFVNLDKLNEIISEYPTPFHLYDEAGIRTTAKAVNNAFSWNPGFREYFAVKACPNPYILKLLKEEGCGVDCASIPELMLAHAVGFTGDEIMFSSNETKAEEYEFARKMNAIINLDDITHIDFLAAHGGLPEKICLRFNPGGDLNIGETCMGHPEESKYGMTRPQILEAARILSERGVKSFGVHALLASNATERHYYPENAAILFSLAAEMHKTLGVDIFMVNLSGGVGIAYLPEEETPDIVQVGADVRTEFERILVAAGLPNVHVASELGRYVTGPNGCLVTTAIHEKHIYREYIGVDACAVDLMRPAMYGAYHHISVMGKLDAPKDQVYDVVGSLCENNDKFAVQRALPKIDMGDVLVIHDTGAHGYSMGYNYNGKLKSAEILLHSDGSFSMIRRAEKPRDYFATLDFSEFAKDLLS